MTGATLGAPALSAAQGAAQDVVDVFAGTVADNIEFVLLISVVGAAMMVVRYIFKRMSRLHRG